MKISIALSIRGVSIHVSAPNSITAWTTALNKFPNTLLSAPSLLKILASRPQLFRSFTIHSDALIQTACTGHHDHLGGGKPPTPNVMTMRHAGTVEGTQRRAPCHRVVQERGGVEETADSGGRSKGHHREGLRGLQEVNRDGQTVQVPGACNDSGG